MLKSLFNLFFPKNCPGCSGLLLESELVICTACRHDLPFTQHWQMQENEIFRRFYGRLPLEHASAMLYFHKQGIVQQLIHNLKYNGREDVGSLMGQWYATDLKNVEELQSVTDIIPVPLHPKKLRERGYNQVEEFGRAIAHILSVPYNDKLLLRTAYTKTQTKKNLEDRAAIIGSAFNVDYTEEDNGKHFLLVDDVMTTGATLESCGRALLSIPGSKLSIVTIAYAHS